MDRLTAVQAASFTLVATAVATTGTARAQVPFKPVPVAPLCSASVNRGAQQALDAFMAKVKEQQYSEKSELVRKLYQERSTGNSTAGLETKLRLLEDTQHYGAQVAWDYKGEELMKYALKRYKCELQLFSSGL